MRSSANFVKTLPLYASIIQRLKDAGVYVAQANSAVETGDVGNTYFTKAGNLVVVIRRDASHSDFIHELVHVGQIKKIGLKKLPSAKERRIMEYKAYQYELQNAEELGLRGDAKRNVEDRFRELDRRTRYYRHLPKYE